MKKNVLNYINFMLMALTMFCLSCNELETNIEAQLEAPKSIEGNWKIMNVTRNDLDITQAADFSQFRISFKGDNTYSLENYLPFIVKGGGTYALDDPKYPFKLNFTEIGRAEPIVTDLIYPVIQGKRQIHLTFRPGCQSNTYKYVLERVEE